MTDDTERWLPVVGFEGYYDVSDHGRVRSLPRVVECNGHPTRTSFKLKGKQLTPSPVTVGYYYVALRRSGVNKHTYVHRLVCEAFHGPCPDRHEVRHLNGDKLDNRATNLAWGTSSQNNHDIVSHGRHHGANKTHCPHNHPLDDENTYWMWNGNKQVRSCLTCRRVRSKSEKRQDAPDQFDNLTWNHRRSDWADNDGRQWSWRDNTWQRFEGGQWSAPDKSDWTLCGPFRRMTWAA